MAAAGRMQPDDVVALIAEIFEQRGARSYLGESVTMAEHMLQAASLAQRDGADEDVIVAALLHDIGYFTSAFPEASPLERDGFHEHAGARLLAPWFPDRVVACVRHHVDAKRYLCAVERDYFEQLSAASVRTLELQGGVMGAAEAARFAQHPDLDAIVSVRRYDDAGKDPARSTPPITDFLPLLRRSIARRRPPG